MIPAPGRSQSFESESAESDGETLAYNVRSEAEVNDVIAAAERAGAMVTQSAAPLLLERGVRDLLGVEMLR
jgi:UDP-N-acetylglucosamine enolpyruvyl transferase